MIRHLAFAGLLIALSACDSLAPSAGEVDVGAAGGGSRFVEATSLALHACATAGGGTNTGATTTQPPAATCMSALAYRLYKRISPSGWSITPGQSEDWCQYRNGARTITGQRSALGGGDFRIFVDEIPDPLTVSNDMTCQPDPVGPGPNRYAHGECFTPTDTVIVDATHPAGSANWSVRECLIN
jgi:hypothetical protein